MGCASSRGKLDIIVLNLFKTVLKEKHKDNNETFKAEMKVLNKATNRVMKDFLGGESMQKIHAHFRAKRENSKK